jgi:hypothetical protein
MSDFKTKFDLIIKNNAKEGFREEYDRLLDLMRQENKKTSNTNQNNLTKQSNSLNLWVEACLQKTCRKIVKKTDPEYDEVKKYYNELKIKK